MLQLQPVVWTRGLLLDPQHLQAQDRYIESQLAFRMRALRPHAWGVTHCVPDDAAIDAGMLALHAVAGLLPDGLAFDTRGTDPLPAPRPLAALLPRDATSVVVHLAVAMYRSGARNVSPRGDAPAGRFLLEWRDHTDETLGAQERPVPVATAHLQLVTEHESRDGLASMPLVRLVRSADGRITRDQAHAPPLLHLAAAPTLRERLASLVERLGTVTTLLASRRRERHHEVAEYSALDLGAFWTLYTLNTQLPLLRHQVATDATHPADLFGSLLTLASALETVTGEGRVRTLPVYEHAAPWMPCVEVMAAIEADLDALLPHRGATIALRERSPGIWVGALPDDWRADTDALILAVATHALSAAELARRVPVLCKVAAADHADALVRHALPGTPLHHLLRPPAGVPLRVDCEYFAIDRDNAAWQRIARTRDVAVYLPHDLPGAHCTLIAVGG
jgi:type VI secretion system protein ImpJ